MIVFKLIWHNHCANGYSYKKAFITLNGLCLLADINTVSSFGITGEVVQVLILIGKEWNFEMGNIIFHQ